MFNLDGMRENNTEEVTSKKIATSKQVSINTSENASDVDNGTISGEKDADIVNDISQTKKKPKDLNGLSNPLLAPYFESSKEAGEFELNSEG